MLEAPSIYKFQAGSNISDLISVSDPTTSSIVEGG
jgi:hypothetical protein